MLAEKTRTIERGTNFKAWIGSSRRDLCCRYLIDSRERAQISSDRIVLAGDASLQIGYFRQRILRAIPAKKCAASLQAQINSRQRLHVTVMQGAGDRLPLCARFEFVQMRLKQRTLLR